jgi:hypothetical protein
LEQLTGESVWLKVFSDTIDVDILYPSFEFLHFPKIKQYQFGHVEYSEENNYQNILIDICDIAEIHKDSIFPTQVILELIDGIQLVIESDCQGGH